ncbi:hypothetical protein [Novosphingopyxis sp. YJ-S2-01]|uniref:hypothetical protein n=1 Tax=Novosphingopyxis sp. YJ-S2-01 TaxID=2794021 RepID=UPI0018DCEB8E|nr:hypothetical protein [Novosphingopyxis sp. YJ-S2-01]MBH9537537.1 hypothetical protein [Novosphingopyxis sp. YJ-S2-01]
MTLITKSDARLVNPAAAIGNIHGFYGAQDYRAMLDFSHQIYRVDGEEKSFSDIVNLVRGGSDAQYLDSLGRYRTVSGNAPRYHMIPEKNEVGLLLEKETRNFLESDADGASFTATDAGEDILVSWRGSGTVTPNASDLALRREVKAGQRTARFYTRSGLKTGTVTVSGEARDIMVTNSNSARTFVPHLATRSKDDFALRGVPFDIVKSGAATLLMRFAFMPDNGNTRRTVFLLLRNDNAPNGLIRILSQYNRTGLDEGSISVVQDGGPSLAEATPPLIARNLGNFNGNPIVGAYFSGFGARAGIISHGQAGQNTAASVSRTPPTAITSMFLDAPDAILTHAVIYDRMVSDDEAFDLAVFGS